MDLRQADLNLLVHLDALLAESSVTRAAERVGLSTAAMSHALSRLREQLKDPILVRAGRSMVPSKRAEQLRPRVRALIEELGVVMSPSTELDPSTMTRGFRIHTTDHVLLVLGAAADRLVRKEAPGVSLTFLPNVPDDATQLRAGLIDLAIGVFTDLPPELRIRTLFEDRFVCVVRRNHPAAKRRLSLARYAAMEHVLVSPRGGAGRYVDGLLEKEGLERRIARSVPYFMAALVLVSKTDYVLTVSERLARAFGARLGLQVLEPPLQMAAYALRMLWHPRYESDPAHAWLRSVFVRAVESSRPLTKSASAR